MNVWRPKTHYGVLSSLYGYLDTLSGDEDYKMENAIPLFPPFYADSDKVNAGPRWDRWIGRLENLFVALKLVAPEDTDANVIAGINDRKRALLLHYVGERTYDIYEAQKGGTEATYDATKKVLSDYFKPRKNTQMEIYTFRCYKQRDDQSLDEFVTELRKLAKNLRMLTKRLSCN